MKKYILKTKFVVIIGAITLATALPIGLVSGLSNKAPEVVINPNTNTIPDIPIAPSHRTTPYTPINPSHHYTPYTPIDPNTNYVPDTPLNPSQDVPIKPDFFQTVEMQVWNDQIVDSHLTYYNGATLNAVHSPTLTDEKFGHHKSHPDLAAVLQPPFVLPALTKRFGFATLTTHNFTNDLKFNFSLKLSYKKGDILINNLSSYQHNSGGRTLAANQDIYNIKSYTIRSRVTGAGGGYVYLYIYTTLGQKYSYTYKIPKS